MHAQLIVKNPWDLSSLKTLQVFICTERAKRKLHDNCLILEHEIPNQTSNSELLFINGMVSLAVIIIVILIILNVYMVVKNNFSMDWFSDWLILSHLLAIDGELTGALSKFTQ